MSMDQLLEQFIGEARELLESAATSFLALEKNPDDAETMNMLFRAVHTLKGTSGIFDVAPLTGVVHAAEDVLDLVREGKMALSSDNVDLFLDSLDQVSAWVDDLENNGVLPDDAGATGSQLSDTLRALISGEKPATDKSESSPDEATGHQIEQPTEAAVVHIQTPDWVVEFLSHIPDEVLRSCYASDPAKEITAIRYQPGEQCFFTGDDPLNNAAHVPALLWHEVEAFEAWPEDDEFDPYLCNLLFYLLSEGDEKEISHALRYITDETETFSIDNAILVRPKGECADGNEYSMFIADADQFIAAGDWDSLKTAIAVSADLAAPGFIQTSALQWMSLFMAADDVDQNMIKHLLETVRSGDWLDFEPVASKPEASAAMQAPTAPSSSPKAQYASEATLLPEASIPRPQEADVACAASILRVQIEALSLPCAVDMWAGRHASVVCLLKGLCAAPDSLTQVALQSEEEHSFHPILNWVEALLSQWDDSSAVAQSLDIVADIARQDMAKEDQGSASKTKKPTVLRVEQERIDQLMDLVGELVVAKNGLPFLSDKAENEYGVKALAREIKGQYEVVNRLSEEFQNIVMRIRMVSLSTVFQRFPRLVRDLSRRLDKKIELVIEGEDTEADKNVVEALADPLIHLVRNSLDHGIEMPADRVAAGKPELGRITLRAIQQEDQVLIEVIDDGKGLNPDALKQKAYEKGLIDEERLENISDHDALQLILRAGFSMANEVSDLSGRGVGMDVVNSMVKQAGGSIMLHSTVGEGSTVRLSLPLSMAVTRVMMVSVDEQRFGVSIDQIVETVKIPASEIHRVKNNEAIVLRDRLIPLCHLRHALDMQDGSQKSDADEVAILVVSFGQGLMGLVVDEFHAGLDIIQKPLEGVMAGFPLFSGTALLGDGAVLLILNLKELSTCQ